MKQLIKDIEKLLKSAREEDRVYAQQLLTWLKNWLTPKGDGPQTQDGGDTPPPPPPHK